MTSLLRKKFDWRKKIKEKKKEKGKKKKEIEVIFVLLKSRSLIS